MNSNIFRRNICLVLLCLCALVAMPLGKIVTRGVRLLPNDMTGQMSHVKDHMGRDTYLLKVKLPYPGAIFDGMVKYEYLASEYHVWMEDGNKWLDIRFPGCESAQVNLQDLLGEPLTAPRTYELTLDLDALEYRASDPQTPQDIGQNYVVFTISPAAAGAVLTIDGNALQFEAGQVMTPLLPYGDYAWSIVAPGYSQSQGTVHVISGDVVQETVTLRSTQGTLVVKSSTPATTIKVDDKVVSTTGNWSGLLPGASHKVECTKDAYRPSTKMVEVIAGQTVTLDFDALTPITGTLPVQVKPIGSQVKVDGKDMGVTPLILKDLLIGTHKIEVPKSGYQTFTATVIVEEGVGNSPLTVDLEKAQMREESEHIFADPEQQASFPGGAEALRKWLNSNIRYPEHAQENGIEGRVMVKFVVGKDGIISNVVIARGVDRELDREAVRVVRRMPRWIPGKMNGEVVPTYYYLPVGFKLQ